MGELIFGGISSKEIGLEVEHFPDFEIPERDYTVTHVPGRNGDVIWDNGSYKNVSRKYDISIGRFGMGGHEHVTGSYESETGSEIYSGLTEEYQSIFHLLDRDSYIGSKIKIAFTLNKTTSISVKINNDERTITTFISVEQDMKIEESIDVSSYGIDNITDISIAIEPHQDEGSVTMTLYSIIVMSVKDTYEQMAIHVLNWLHQDSGYLRLEDSYEPSYYRLASYKENVDISNILAQGGKATITFDCKPQRFLKEENPWIISQGYDGADPVKAFAETTYNVGPILRIEIFPVIDDLDVASEDQPDEVWASIRIDEHDEPVGSIHFMDIQSHIGRQQAYADTLVVDIDLVYGKCIGVYKYDGGELKPYSSYEKTNVVLLIGLIDEVIAAKEMWYTAHATQYGEGGGDPYDIGTRIMQMSCNLRRYLV